jgi:KAP family P-loop domain
MSKEFPELTPDLPEVREEALWPRVQALADRLADRIDDFHATSPVLISGDWGQGKTTLLRAIQRRIDRQSEAAGLPRTLFFEAWRYEACDLLLPALLRAIWEVLPEKNRPSATLGQKLWHWGVVCSVAMAGGLAKIAGGPAGPLVDALLGLRKDEQEGGVSREFTPPMDGTKELQRSFQSLVGCWAAKQPLVVFIDDLDRCSPAGAVNLLDALRHLLYQATTAAGSGADMPCRFVVALDRKVISEAISNKFASLGSYDGNRYLEKIFPLAFVLPRPEMSDVRQFVATVLRSEALARPENRVEGTIRGGGKASERLLSDEIDALEAALADPLFANPRLMKRCVSRFRLVLAFERQVAVGHGGQSWLSAGAKLPEDHLTILARWIAATERWPGLRQLLARQGDEPWDALREAPAVVRPKDLDPDFAKLFEEYGVKSWLTQILHAAGGSRIEDLRAADRRLRIWGL